MNELDEMLAALRSQPADRRLDSLEPAVWTRLQGQTAPGVTAGWRAAMAALALGLGAAVGAASASAAAPSDAMAAFSSRAAFAPSTLLEGPW